VAQALHAIADVARELGRFEMTVNPARPNVSRAKSELTPASLREMGLDRALSIVATKGDYLPGLRPATLERLGRKVAGGWALDPPTAATAAAWRRLLDSDMPLVFEAPADEHWIENCIGQLHAPILVIDGNPGLSNDALRACRTLLESVDDKVVFACGLYRQTMSVFGKGPAFEAALAAMSRRPQTMWGLDDAGRDALLKQGFRLFKRKRAAANPA
jgi:hypothetical protein